LSQILLLRGKSSLLLNDVGLCGGVRKTTKHLALLYSLTLAPNDFGDPTRGLRTDDNRLRGLDPTGHRQQAGDLLNLHRDHDHLRWPANDANHLYRPKDAKYRNDGEPNPKRDSTLGARRIGLWLCRRLGTNA
jgi:hypothetical protein